MKNIARHVLRKLVRYLARHADLGTFETQSSGFDNSPEAVAFLAEEQEADWDFYGITLH